jgi:hypothetical protein
MSINSIDIHEDRINLVVHLDDEEPILCFEIPRENDGSDNWTRVQTWLDEGNEISDRLDYSKYYSDMRKPEYDALNQFELQYDDSLDGGTRWEDAIQAIKNKFPKPE